MVSFHLSSFIATMVTYSMSAKVAAAFEVPGIVRGKNRVNFQTKLRASIQEDQEATTNIPNREKIFEAEHHEHTQLQKSPYIIIEGKEADAHKPHVSHQHLGHGAAKHHQSHQQHLSSLIHTNQDFKHHVQSAHGLEHLQLSHTQQPHALKQEQRGYKQEKSHVLTIEEMGPAFKFTNKKGNTKVLNLYGLYNLIVIIATMPFWLLAMEILQHVGDAIEGFDPNRAKFDFSGKLWCRTYLRLVDSYPEIAGDVSRLKDKESGGYDGACLFVANHASFLDIAVLCTVLDPVFKFIAKDSLAKFPGVGKQLVGVSSCYMRFLHKIELSLLTAVFMLGIREITCS